MNEKKPIIICVDDEKFILDTLGAQLQQKFGKEYDFEFAERAEEAIALIGDLGQEGCTVVMIISDQRMPGMNGDEFLTEIHQNHPLPIKILLTGQASLESAVNAINNANLYRYISKPWNQDDLLLTVQKGLQQYDLFVKNQQQIEVFKQFVPQQFIESLGLKSLTDIKLGKHVEKGMCIFFSDIRGFTNLSEKMTPEENYCFVNEYIKYIEPAIANNRGFIDKFIGDAVMALFPRVIDAVQAAIDTQLALGEFNKLNRSYGPIKIGIGLHAGDLMLGIVGVDARLQCTVISDSVNLASRIQELSSSLDTEILVTQEVVDQTQSDEKSFLYRLVGRVIVKGREEVVTVYEALDEKNNVKASLKAKTRDDFESGIHLFWDKKFAEACVLFKKVTAADPGDRIANLYLRVSANYIVSGVSEDWVGAELV